MANQDIPVTSPKTGRSIVLTKNFGDNLADAVTKFGEAAVFTGFVRMAAQDAGNAARRLLNDAKYTPEQVKEKLDQWKPGVAMPRSSAPADPIGAFINKIGTLTSEELDAELARVMEAINKVKGA